MKMTLLLVTLFGLTACGVETVGTAATAAAVKKQELEQGQKNLQAVQQKLDLANQQMQQRQDATNEASK